MSRIHKWVHRIAGGSVVLTASLQKMSVVDFGKLFGDVGATKIALVLGSVICALEFLPFIASIFEDEDTK